jgi:hypothetical protein
MTWCVSVFLEGLVATVFLLKTPGESNNAWLIGLSKSRALILGGIVGVLLINIFSAYQFGKKTRLGKTITILIQNLLTNSLLYYGLVGLFLFGSLILSQVLHLSQIVSDPFVQGYLTRMLPLLFWLLAICIQTLLLLPFFRFGFKGSGKIFQRGILNASSIIFLVIIAIGIFVVITGIGLDPDKIGWDAPGVPVLPLQVGFICLLAALVLLLEPWFWNVESKTNLRFFPDLFFSVLLWGSAFVIWFQEPLTPDFFAPEPRPPNYEIYPHSDAAHHDTTAQQLLIGEGFPGVPRKPIYVLFLALLHGIAGQNYLDVIILQVGVLAFFPVFIYWIAKVLHHRVSGLIAAGFIIIRERNAIALSGEIGVSHSKLMMSDLPAAMAIVIVTLMLVLWLRDPQKRRLFPLGIGASVGLLMLLRPQFIFMVPPVILFVGIAFKNRLKLGVVNLGLIAGGLLLILSPWLFRSYNITGRFTLNDPKQMAFLTQQYRLEPGLDSLQKNPDEADADFIQRINDHVQGFALKHPDVVVNFVVSHFFHNKVEMLQALPVTFWAVQNPDSDLFPYWRENWNKLWNDCCSTHAYVRSVGYWDPIRADITLFQFPVILINVWLMSLGLGVAWVRRDLLGFIPLGVGLFYSLSTSVGRYSGWRLILPADWVIYLYYSLGIGYIIIWLHSFFTRKSVKGFGVSKPQKTWQRISESHDGFFFPVRSNIIFGVILFGIGMIPLLVEIVVPVRYVDKTEDELIASVIQNSGVEIRSIMDRENATVVQGRALYPRFFKDGSGEPGSGWPAFSVRDFDRVGFIVISGSNRFHVIMPMEEPPLYFPNASDVIVVGCQVDDYIDAGVIYIIGNTNHILERSNLASPICSNPNFIE